MAETDSRRAEGDERVALKKKKKKKSRKGKRERERVEDE